MVALADVLLIRVKLLPASVERYTPCVALVAPSMAYTVFAWAALTARIIREPAVAKPFLAKVSPPSVET